MIRIRNILRAGRRFGSRRQVAKGDKTVVRFLGQLEHLKFRPFRSCIEDSAGTPASQLPPGASVETDFPRERRCVI